MSSARKNIADKQPHKSAEKQYQEAVHALNQHQYGDAERHFRRFLKEHPNHVGALNLLTIVLVSLHRYAEAEPIIARALELDRSSDISFYNHGLILKHLGKPKQAAEQFTHSLRLNETIADTWNNRGATRHDLGDYKGALSDFDRAIALAPNNAATYANRARALTALARYDEALSACNKALAIDPRQIEAWLGRGNVLVLRGSYDDAFTAYRQALAINPARANAHAGMGNALRELGRLDEAREAYLQGLALEPRCGEFLFHYANIKRMEAGDPRFAAMEALSTDVSAPPLDRMHGEFALGKAYNDIGDHARAFSHWRTANALKREQIAYDEAAVAAEFAAIENVFTRALIEAKSGDGDPSALPVFVLGMPRSGTTLVEQIIACHPDVHGAGELSALDDILGAVPGADGQALPYPRYVPALDCAAIRDLGGRCVAALARLAPAAARITDKLPANFFFIGMIHLALPNAKIVHCVRDPVDTCLSCFSNLFADALDFTYDLGELGRYYARYQRLMSHWESVLPPGRILEVRYEDVVADLEGQARRLIDHCGLAWDQRCLAFNESARPVRTVSAAQVRQPLYRQSVGRWRVFEQELTPLLRALEPDTDAC